MNKKNFSQKGQALILIALGMVGLLGITALAIDGGNLYSERRHAQNAADTAALSGALEITKDTFVDEFGITNILDDKDGKNWYAIASELTKTNGYDIADVSNPVVINNPPSYGCKGEQGPYFNFKNLPGTSVEDYKEYVQILITINVKTYFGKVIGIDQTTSCVEAIAEATLPYVVPLFAGSGIVALNPGEPQFPCGGTVDGINFQGNASYTSSNAGFFSNANCPGAFTNNSNAHFDAPSILTVGSIIISETVKDGVLLRVPPGIIQSGEEQQIFPPEYALPEPAKDCGSRDIAANDTQQQGMWLSPGNYPPGGSSKDKLASFPPAGVTNLYPGLYCIYAEKGFIVDNKTSLRGDGVTLAVMKGLVSWTGSAGELGGIQLHAPSSKPYNCLPGDLREVCNNKYDGLLMFIPKDNIQANCNPVPCEKDGVTFNGSANWNLTGTILAPWTNFKINGGQDGFSIGTQIIGFDVILTGDGVIDITYDGNDLWKGPYPSKIELSH